VQVVQNQLNLFYLITNYQLIVEENK